MKVGIISDTHDNIENIKKMIKKLKENSVDVIIHCGDFCSPFSVKMLAEIEVPIHAVWGNNDGDKITILKVKPKNITIHGILGEVEIGGRKFGITHYPEVGKLMALSGKYDVVCYGHTHHTKIEKVGKCLLINPGEITTLLGKSTFVIYDTSTEETKTIEI